MPGRWHGTIQRYLADIVYGATDGIVTTLAIVSGVVGASLDPRVILILGFANLLADGFSMGASNFLSKRTGMRAAEQPSRREASRHGYATFMGFIVAGFMPLLAYLIPGVTGERFILAVILGLATLFAVGAGRALFSDVSWSRAGFEMFAVGAIAGAVAYGIGMAGAQVIGT